MGLRLRTTRSLKKKDNIVIYPQTLKTLRFRVHGYKMQINSSLSHISTLSVFFYFFFSSLYLYFLFNGNLGKVVWKLWQWWQIYVSRFWFEFSISWICLNLRTKQHCDDSVCACLSLFFFVFVFGIIDLWLENMEMAMIINIIPRSDFAQFGHDRLLITPIESELSTPFFVLFNRITFFFSEFSF